MLKQFENGELYIKIEVSDKGEDILEKLYLNYNLYFIEDFYINSNGLNALDFNYNGTSNYYTMTVDELDKLEIGEGLTLKPIEGEHLNYLIELEEFLNG